MKYHPHGSLRSIMSIPQVVPHDLTGLMVNEIVIPVKAYWDEIEAANNKAKPDTDAIEFYALNHMVSILSTKFGPDAILPDWAQPIARRYADVISEQGQRLYSYMLLIITRESRHLKNPGSVFTTAPVAFKNFHAEIKGQGSIQVAQKLCAQPPQMALGRYVYEIVNLFNNGSFSGGYGGEPWGNIAKCLLNMVEGKFSIELMCDAAYALAHNNGPMFNKGMLYHGYSHEFLKILDVQRSGQMLEAVIHSEFKQMKAPLEIEGFVKTMKKHYPDAFGDYVDWHKVESLGSVGKYAAEKKAMPKKPVAVKPGTKTFLEAGTLDLLPGVSVTITKRVAA